MHFILRWKTYFLKNILYDKVEEMKDRYPMKLSKSQQN